MKLYSWNVWCDNDPQRVFDFIAALEYDVLCLQEVTPALLERLQALEGSVVYGKEGTRLYHDRTEVNYSVILSPYPLTDRGTIALPAFQKPAAARVLDRLMRWSFASERQAVQADLRYAGQEIRIVCAHLTLSSPPQRQRELDTILATLPSDTPAILAGDFNVLESWHILPVNLLHGGSARHALPLHDERASVEARVMAAGLANPLRGRATHALSRSQLDHILLSSQFSITEARVLADARGSDHRPVFVAAELKGDSRA